MNRLTRPQMFLEMAEVAAKRSTCYRGNVGAILVGPDHNIVSIGYNGPKSGEPHCMGLRCERTESGGCKRSVHAEVNAINRAPHIPRGSALFCSYSPCAECALKILAHPEIRFLYYRIPYRDLSGLQWMMKSGMTIGRVTPNGTVVDELTKEIVEAMGS